MLMKEKRGHFFGIVYFAQIEFFLRLMFYLNVLY